MFDLPLLADMLLQRFVVGDFLNKGSDLSSKKAASSSAVVSLPSMVSCKTAAQRTLASRVRSACRAWTFNVAVIDRIVFQGPWRTHGRLKRSTSGSPTVESAEPVPRHGTNRITETWAEPSTPINPSEC